VADDKLAGQVLAVRSGGLRRSIAQAIVERRGEILGRVGLDGIVPYGAIYEFGGRTPAHAVLPRRARVLAFKKDGKTVFAARVAHPGSAIPERSFLRAALAELTPEIHAALAAAVAEGLRRARP
jgi:phage gpG-like protein